MANEYSVLSAFLEKRTATLRAFLFGRNVPCHELALRIVLTAVILFALFRLFEKHFLSAVRANSACFLNYFLGILALRKT